MIDIIGYSLWTDPFWIVNSWSSLFARSLTSPSNFWYCFSAMSVCLFSSISDGENSNVLIVAALSSSPFSGKTSSSVENSY